MTVCTGTPDRPHEFHVTTGPSCSRCAAIALSGQLAEREEVASSHEERTA